MSTKLPQTITICLTEACNLDCIYCYEKNKSSNSITLPILEQIIQSAFENASNHSHTIFELFGGEPFIKFDLIKQIVPYIKSIYKDVPYTISITTNGTLVHKEIQEWLIDNKDIINLGLSLDGTKSMHDINRSGSFDSIDIRFFANYSDNPRVKMTISNETLQSLAEGVIFLHKCGFIVDCNLAYGIDWSNVKNTKALYEQLQLLIEFYINNPDVQPCSMLSSHIEVVNVPPTSTVKKWCGTGKYMKAYDIRKNKFPCQFFMPQTIPEEKYINVDIPDDIPLEFLPDKCQSCPCVNICPTCYGSNYLESGNFYKKSDDYCNMMKVVFLANSYFKWSQLSSKSFNFTENERLVYMHSIYVIQTFLQNDYVIKSLDI